MHTYTHLFLAMGKSKCETNLHFVISLLLLLFGNTIKEMARKPVKKAMENLARCAEEFKQSKGNTGEGKRALIPPSLNFVMKAREEGVSEGRRVG